MQVRQLREEFSRAGQLELVRTLAVLVLACVMLLPSLAHAQASLAGVARLRTAVIVSWNFASSALPVA